MAGKRRANLSQPLAFQHTQLGVYLVGGLALLSLCSDSAQGIIEKYHINKKWFYLQGAMSFFAYVYMRPYIRQRIGSAQRGYVNFYTLYICWLCSAVFYHLPSFQALGIDIKADVSLLLSVFFSSLSVLGVLHALQLVLISLRFLPPIPGVTRKELFSCVLLNAMSLAVACSTYFNLCGNGGFTLDDTPNAVKAAICGKWLHPIPTTQYPKFSAWMLYGEGANAHNSTSNTDGTPVLPLSINIDLPLDGMGIVSVPAGSVISPVFTMWITLVMLYIVNIVADHFAAWEMAARHISELRRQLSDPDVELLKQLATSARQLSMPLLSSDEEAAVEALATAASTPARTRSMELNRSFTGWASPRTVHAAVRSLLARTQQQLSVSSSGQLFQKGVGSIGTTAPKHKQKQQAKQAPKQEEEGPEAQPAFQDMVPWYSGTSADLFKTAFDLMVSFKLFLGRFDMRTMQAATAASMADSFNDTPSEGDGFTYEHFSERSELWLDFMADTGDGGNPTYAVARALAAPSLTVPVAPGVSVDTAAGDATSAAGKKQQQEQQQRQQQRRASGHGQQAPVQLPRANVLLLGGDLAYPNPCRETYEQRLFVPFQDAMPPPPHYYPGRLVVHKPDLPPVYGVQEAGDSPDLRGLSPRSSRNASVAALRRYSGPNCFAIPGNHDWIDGLETFIRHIQHKGWLGGWLLPQEKSYFALNLPHGWWVFGVDLALVGDIDMCQYRYFANVVEQRMGPDDNVIIITHEPIWLLEWFWATASGSNLRQLVRGHLRGRARLHLAGDLHFYMRHSFRSRAQQQLTELLQAHQAQQQKQQEEEEQQQRKQGKEPGPPQQGGDTQEPKLAASAAKQHEQMPMAHAANGHSPAGINGHTHHNAPTSNGVPHIRAAPLDAPSVRTQARELLQQQLPHSGRSSTTSSLLGASPPHVAAVHKATPDRPSSRSGRGPALGSSGTVAPDGAQVLQGTLTPFAQLSLQGGPLGRRPGSSGGAANRSMPDVTALQERWEQLRQASIPQRPARSAAAASSGGCSPAGSFTAHGASPRVRHVRSGSGSLRLPFDYQDSSEDSDGEVSDARAAHAGAVSGTGVGGARAGVNGPGSASAPATGLGVLGERASSQRQAVGSAGRFIGGSPAERGHSGRMVRANSPVRVMQENLPRLTIDPPSGSSTARGGAAGGDGAAAGNGSSVADLLMMPQSPCAVCGFGDPGSHLCDPEHLICNGGGGAFMHPTHVFSYARFAPLPDEAAEATAAIYSSARERCTCRSYPTFEGPNGDYWDPDSGAWHYPMSPSGRSADAPEGEYRCAAVFPSPEASMKLGRKNLHLFRSKNTRFDVIGGMIYFLLIVSIMPRCNLGPSILDAPTFVDGLLGFGAAFWGCVGAIFAESYLSLAMAVCMFLICLGFARGGGVGAAPTPALRAKVRRSGTSVSGASAGGASPVPSVQHGGKAPAPGVSGNAIVGPLVRLRTGGAATQLLLAAVHSMAHLSLAITLLLLLELAVEMCIRYEELGAGGMHSLFRWFVAWQDEHFPDPMGLRAMLTKWTLGAYPGVLKWAMAIFDVPEAIAAARTAVCAASPPPADVSGLSLAAAAGGAGGGGGAAAGSVAAGFAALGRLHVLAYYGGMLAYYWVLAIPGMGVVLGLYLYVCVCWFHVHYDEAFSALRIANFKGFCRLHITPEGDLEVFSLGCARVPARWKEDPKWSGPGGGGDRSAAAHAAEVPSRWVPADGGGAVNEGDGLADEDEMGAATGGDGGGVAGDASCGFRVVDYLRVPRKRAFL